MKTNRLRRKCEIIRELCRLSKDGWHKATPEEYEPLEAELAKLEAFFSNHKPN